MSVQMPVNGTFFAPPERAPQLQVHQASRILSELPLIQSLLECVPAFAAVLNRHRQIVVANHRMIDLLQGTSEELFLGARPGEALGCVHHAEGPGGCGTAEACRYCGAVQAVLECHQTGRQVVHECRLRRTENGREQSLDLRLQVQPLPGGTEDEILFYATDISDEKRREVLERTFFHDVMNTVSALGGLVEVLSTANLDASTTERCQQSIARICEQLTEEIQCQRNLLAAERGELQVDLRDEPVLNLVADVLKTYRHHAQTFTRELVLDSGPLVTLRTDPVLLRRCLGNLVKNGLEASPANGAVTLGWRVEGDRIVLFVNNAGVMKDVVQKQLFQRSFSTKEGAGRGIGVYSVKLFCEQYLAGQVSFSSTPEEGTTFSLTFPN